MKTTVVVGSLLALTVLVPAVADEIGESEQGKKLFERHGCTTCHGAEGVHPISRYVPLLKGESANYIYENASAIFGGLRKSGKTHFMYDQRARHR